MILKRVGGKSKIADWIKFHMPAHRIFVDVFGGSGAVLNEMIGADNCRYVYNDLDNKLYAFFKVLQDRAPELEDIVACTPYSRKFFEEAHSLLLDAEEFAKLDMLDQALAFLIVNRQSFGSKMTNTWSVAREGEVVYETWSKVPELISQVSEKWRSVFLENMDYQKILQKWDSDHTTFYLDPPYEGVESEYYAVNKESGFDHDQMFEALQGIDGSYMVSYYDGSIVERYRQAGCHVVEQEVKIHIAREGKATKTEVLIISENEWAKHNRTSKAIKGRQAGDIFR